MNADAERLLEFIAFYECHRPRHRWELEALAELIIASVDEALVDGTARTTHLDRFEAFVASHGQEFPSQMAYWSSLDPSDFPVVRVLREVGAS